MTKQKTNARLAAAGMAWSDSGLISMLALMGWSGVHGGETEGDVKVGDKKVVIGTDLRESTLGEDTGDTSQ